MTARARRAPDRGLKLITAAFFLSLYAALLLEIASGWKTPGVAFARHFLPPTPTLNETRNTRVTIGVDSAICFVVTMGLYWIGSTLGLSVSGSADVHRRATSGLRKAGLLATGFVIAATLTVVMERLADMHTPGVILASALIYGPDYPPNIRFLLWAAVWIFTDFLLCFGAVCAVYCAASVLWRNSKADPAAMVIRGRE
ncbi:MAG TPA: hypothetical protein VMT53_23510 [Terriglobales bacterium]|nr:hypothetical protein [Terriglobales bacterium]